MKKKMFNELLQRKKKTPFELNTLVINNLKLLIKPFSAFNFNIDVEKPKDSEDFLKLLIFKLIPEASSELEKKIKFIFLFLIIKILFFLEMN